MSRILQRLGDKFIIHLNLVSGCSQGVKAAREFGGGAVGGAVRSAASSDQDARRAGLSPGARGDLGARAPRGDLGAGDVAAGRTGCAPVDSACAGFVHPSHPSSLQKHTFAHLWPG